MGSLMSGSHKWSIDFARDAECVLHRIDVPFELDVTRTGVVHGIAFWFDVAFIGSRHVEALLQCQI